LFSLDWWRYPIEINAPSRLPHLTSDLRNVFILPDANTLWVIGKGGMIIHSTNGGRTWEQQHLTRASGPQEQPQQQIPMDLRGVYFINHQEGWVVGAHGAIFHTANGGHTWTPQLSGEVQDLQNVQFLADGRQGWAVGGSGTILHTTDGGATWVRQPSKIQALLRTLYFLADGRQGWVGGGSGTVIHTSDGGETWSSPLSIHQVNYFSSIQFLADGRQGWVVGDDGTILYSPDGGLSWGPQSSNTQKDLHSVHFLVDGLQGWVVGYDTHKGNTEDDVEEDVGIILHTTDGGNTWVRQSSAMPWRLETVRFHHDGYRGWTVGTNGTVLYTADGGNSWAPQTDHLRPAVFSPDSRTYRIWHAPWYYVIGLALPLALLLFAWRHYEPPLPTTEESVADLLVSDRPLAAGEPDPLEFDAIARGLSRFLRNDKTQPPLTIAITGEWGSGKSSLMNLLKADLEHYGFHPVWFNAWHHQQEEQLLAALLEGVRSQGVPPWWHPVGLLFRGRLLALRGRRHWLPFLLIALGIVFSTGYFVAHPQSPTEVLQQVQQTIAPAINWGKKLFGGGALPKSDSQTPGPSTSIDIRALFPLLGSISALLFALGKEIIAFGAHPAHLLASVSGNAQIRDLGAQAGFRQKFAAEFRDVTQALRPHTMLILIDDLDRCRPEKVLEVLEAINFLVVSGECYVVMGMALERVERCVGLGFKDVAEELVDEQGGEPQNPSVAGRQKRGEFARQYLEKLINIEVPVPTPTLAQTSRLLTTPESPRPSPASDFWKHQLRLVLVAARRFWRWAIFASIFASVFWLGMISHLPSKQGTEPNLYLVETPPASRVAPPRQPRGQAVAASPATEDDLSALDIEFAPGQQSRLPAWPPLIPISALLTAGVWMVLKSFPQVVVRDSPEFAEALKIWLPVIITKQHTPRSIKRFLNRVRYLAMRQRPSEAAKTMGGRLWPWVRQTAGFAPAEPTPQQTANTIPESLLVALSALQMGYAEVNGRQNPLQNLDVSLRQEELSQPGQENRHVLQEALGAHEKRFKNSSTMQAYWNTFVEVARGIRVS
jgi:photosystem II stability/assembly factor-like uncharacterized protein